MTESTRGRRARIAGIVAMATVAVLAAACTSATPGRYDPQTYPVDVELPPQSVNYVDGNCSATTVTSATPLAGATVTVPAFGIKIGASVTLIEDVQVYVPAATIDAGLADWVCDGIVIDQVSLTLSFEGTVAARSGNLLTANKTLTLIDSTVDLANATVTVEGFPPDPMPTPTVTIPNLVLDL